MLPLGQMQYLRCSLVELDCNIELELAGMLININHSSLTK